MPRVTRAPRRDQRLPGGMWSPHLAQQPQQVERSGRGGKDAIDLVAASTFTLPSPAVALTQTGRALDTRPAGLGPRVPRVSVRAVVDRATALPHGVRPDGRREPERAGEPRELERFVALVGLARAEAPRCPRGVRVQPSGTGGRRRHRCGPVGVRLDARATGSSESTADRLPIAGENMKLDERIARDTANATRASEAARREIVRHKGPQFKPTVDIVHGVAGSQLEVVKGLEGNAHALHVIADDPFHAMLEAEIERRDGRLRVLWYANKDTRANQWVTVDGTTINILAWTHPGFQKGLIGELEQWVEFSPRGFNIAGVRPFARARFTQTAPTVAGLYDPGGRVNGVVQPPRHAVAGLKSVKLDMTPEQVKAFIARMDGVVLVTGAPGTGKTTIALQRIRFLFDQQDLRDGSGHVLYAPALTCVFLSSDNLVSYTRDLLRNELGLPSDLVSHVRNFIESYLDQVWQSRGSARPVTRRMPVELQRARHAMLNLCSVRDLSGVWLALEDQARQRLKNFSAGDWMDIVATAGAAGVVAALAERLGDVPRNVAGDPVGSAVRMDQLWLRVRRPYDECRQAMGEHDRDRFDRAFVNWLFWVFDPVDALHAYFGERQGMAVELIRRGVPDLAAPQTVVAEVLADWGKRLYGPEALAWFSWVLRFALPEEAAQDEGFRGVPRAIPTPTHQSGGRWTHVVIDEAQDLSVQEASLLASLVHPRGSLTVSADFRQVVSPVHGMTDGEALKVGLPIWDPKLHTQFPFQRNLRQSREIAQFLRAFYQRAFGEIPRFDAGDRAERVKPQLYVGRATQFPTLIAQMWRTFAATGSLQQVAVIHVNEDTAAIDRLRAALVGLRVPVAAADAIPAESGLVVTSAERAKGLEFEACIVLGLEDVERSMLNFAKNRAYVALSRPTRRLFMLCNTDPILLQNVQPDLYQRRSL